MYCKQIQVTKAANEELWELTAVVSFGSVPETPGHIVTFTDNAVFTTLCRVQLYWKKNVKPNQNNAKLSAYLGPSQGQNSMIADTTFYIFFSELENT